MIPSSRHLPKLTARFFRTEGGTEPVREWLKGLPADDRKRVGDEIRKVQFGWPVGMPLVRKLGPELWEVRATEMNTALGRLSALRAIDRPCH